MADAGVAARRECEELVLSGAVTVNGKVIDRLPAWVDPATDKIEVYGRPLRKAEKHVYIMLFKPRGTVCTNSDPEGRPRAIDLVQHPSKPRLYCVGRLDLDSSGLLILTNDGEFANRVTHPRYLVEKGYDLTVDGRLDEKAIADLERKIFAAERGARAGDTRSSLRLVSRDRDKTVIHLTLCEHRNLQIRPLMLELGHPVNKLRRTSFGPLRLKGLAVGEWRELAPREVEQLLRASKSEDPGARRAPRAPKRSMAELAIAREERAQRLAAESAAAAPPAARAPEPKRREQTKPARRPERKDGPRRPDGKAPRSGEQSRGGRPPRSGKPAPRGRRPRKG
ncbi:MAG: Ribosomal large subunit pseudouridine synthase [Planctomycetota bacterium]|jgi:pseudouridine synthase